MPFVCLEDGARICVRDFNPRTWANLQNTHRARNLRMQCGQPAIPRASFQGKMRPHFAHLSKVGCDCDPDTPEHGEVKWQAYDAAKLEGWTPEFEMRGENLDGSRWQVDVLCTKGDKKIAFQIVVLPRSAREYLTRNMVYRAAGIRCCFLVRHNLVDGLFPMSNATLPLFRLTTTEAPRFRVDLPGQIPRLPLMRFVRGALTGQLQWDRAAQEWYWVFPEEGEANLTATSAEAS